MKPSTLIFLTALAGGSLCAQDFTLHQKPVPQPEQKSAKVVEQAKQEGSIQHAARFKNPLQAVNPLAPAEYGSSREYVYYDENDPNQHPRGHKENPKAVKLFSFFFW